MRIYFARGDSLEELLESAQDYTTILQNSYSHLQEEYEFDKRNVEAFNILKEILECIKEKTKLIPQEFQRNPL